MSNNKRRVSNSASARKQRSATAYFRLAQKAALAGDYRTEHRHNQKGIRLREQANALKARGM